MQTAVATHLLARSRLSQLAPCFTQHQNFISPRAPQYIQQQRRQLHWQQTAAVPHPQQPERVDVRAASSNSSSASGSSSSVTISGSFSSGLRPAAFKRHGITGDGSCMFRWVRRASSGLSFLHMVYEPIGHLVSHAVHDCFYSLHKSNPACRPVLHSLTPTGLVLPCPSRKHEPRTRSNQLP